MEDLDVATQEKLFDLLARYFIHSNLTHGFKIPPLPGAEVQCSIQKGIAVQIRNKKLPAGSTLPPLPQLDTVPLPHIPKRQLQPELQPYSEPPTATTAVTATVSRHLLIHHIMRLSIWMHTSGTPFLIPIAHHQEIGLRWKSMPNTALHRLLFHLTLKESKTKPAIVDPPVTAGLTVTVLTTLFLLIFEAKCPPQSAENIILVTPGQSPPVASVGILNEGTDVLPTPPPYIAANNGD
ncbi:hypothetical protein Pelo_18377 [Pelomyxa schiedti]|nr:hypothetical protein Pelo_18377 [Pelomyxa schiedti]